MSYDDIDTDGWSFDSERLGDADWTECEYTLPHWRPDADDDDSRADNLGNAPAASYSAAVRALCTSLGMDATYVASAAAIARKYFVLPNDGIQTQVDPETGESWVVLRVVADGSVEDILDKEDAYLSEFDSAVPRAMSGNIRLSLDVN